MSIITTSWHVNVTSVYHTHNLFHLTLNMNNWLHNIWIRIRNTLLMPNGNFHCYRCSHSVKNMQKNSNNNNNNYIWCIFIIESYCNFTVFTMKYYCIHYHIYNVSWSLSLHCWKKRKQLTAAAASYLDLQTLLTCCLHDCYY